MRCPNDNTEMQVVTKNGITIDHCTTCKGIWLDRGELEKIIETVEARTEEKVEKKEELERQRQYPDIKGGFARRSRRRGFLDDLFDFTGA